MQTVSIRTNNSYTIKAIEALVKLDKSAIMTYDESGDLSEKDTKKLLELIEKDDKGELRFHSDAEVSKRLAKKGIKW